MRGLTRRCADPESPLPQSQDNVFHTEDELYVAQAGIVFDDHLPRHRGDGGPREIGAEAN